MADDDNPLRATWSEADEAALAAGRADHAAGRTVPGAEVMAWVRSWGEKDERPPPAVEDKPF